MGGLSSRLYYIDRPMLTAQVCLRKEVRERKRLSLSEEERIDSGELSGKGD